MAASEATARAEATEWERREAALLAFVSDELKHHWRVLGISVPPPASSSSSSIRDGNQDDDDLGSDAYDDDEEFDSMSSSSASSSNRQRHAQSQQSQSQQSQRQPQRQSQSQQPQQPLLTTDAGKIAALAAHVKRLSAALTAARVREEFNVKQVRAGKHATIVTYS